MISSLSVNLAGSMTHCRCTRWSKLICSWSNSSCSIWRACSSCGRAVVRWICHACPTGLVLIILFYISKIERKLKFQLQKKCYFLQASKWTLKNRTKRTNWNNLQKLLHFSDEIINSKNGNSCLWKFCQAQSPAGSPAGCSSMINKQYIKIAIFKPKMMIFEMVPEYWFCYKPLRWYKN